MSKLSQAMRAVQTGRDYAMPQSVMPIICEEKFSHEASFSMHKGYKLSVELHAMARVPTDDGKAISAALASCRRMLVDEVFGEFRPLLYKIKLALMEHEVTKADKAVDDVFDAMFKVEP